MSIITDFPAIAKHARLKALDGKPQNVVAEPDPVLDYGFANSLAAVDTAPSEIIPAGDWYTALTVPALPCHAHSMTDWRWSDAEQRWVQDPVAFVAPRQDPA